MRGFLKEYPGAFNPDEIRTLVAAFDRAWESVQASGAIFDTDAAAEIARAVLAKHIIEAAKQGEHDQRRLRDGARVAFVSSRLIVMAQDYKAKGNAVEAESKSPLTAMVIHSVSPDRETNQS
jgi:hypothetical protein